MHYAAKYGHSSLVESLTNRGADVNAIDKVSYFCGYILVTIQSILEQTHASCNIHLVSSKGSTTSQNLVRYFEITMNSLKSLRLYMISMILVI